MVMISVVLSNNLPWKRVIFCLNAGNADNSWITILQWGHLWGIHWTWLNWDDKIPLEIITNINFTTNLSQCIHCSTALLFRFPLWPSCGCNIDQDLNCFSDSIQSIYWQNCSSLCSTLALRCASLGLSICNWIFVFIKGFFSKTLSHPDTPAIWTLKRKCCKAVSGTW